MSKILSTCLTIALVVSSAQSAFGGEFSSPSAPYGCDLNLESNADVRSCMIVGAKRAAPRAALLVGARESVELRPGFQRTSKYCCPKTGKCPSDCAVCC